MHTRSAPASRQCPRMRSPNSSREAQPAALDDERRDAGPPGAFDAAGVGARRHDADDAGVEPAVGDAVDQVLQRRAAAGQQHGEADGGGHGVSFEVRRCRNHCRRPGVARQAPFTLASRRFRR